MPRTRLAMRTHYLLSVDNLKLACVWSTPSWWEVGISREPTGPLAGITIIEAQQAITGPLGTMMLADMGATVIKIEPPTGPGDVNRPSGVRLGHESGDHSACTYGQSDSAASFHPAGTHQQVAARVLPAAPTAVTAAQISTTSTVGSVV